MAIAKMHSMLCPRAPTISNTTIAMCGHGGPPAQSASGADQALRHKCELVQSVA